MSLRRAHGVPLNARVHIAGRRPPSVPAEPVAHAVLRRVLRWPGRIVDVWDGWTGAGASKAPLQAGMPREPAVWTPDAYYGLQPGLSHVRRGEDWAALRVEGGTALVVGGPQAPQDRRGSLLRSVVESTGALGVRRQIVFPVRESDRDVVRGAGFATLQVGVEAWIDLADFHLRGKRWAHVRQMRNRAEKRGVHVEETAPGPWDDAMRAVWRAWVAAKRPRWGLRWLTGTPGLDRPLGRRYFVAHAQGRLQAFCTLLPGPAGTWSVDVLCRAPGAVPGSMERLLVHACQTVRDEGARAINLGPCPLAHSDEAPPRGLLGAVFRWAWASKLGGQLFGFRRLHAFKAKFNPRWEPVYLGAAPRMGWVELYSAARVWALSDPAS